MIYQRSHMINKDYKWTVRADHDNPKIIGAQDSAMLNRDEGYEMLYFINSLGKSWAWKDNLGALQRLEGIIKNIVPSNIRTHSGIKKWIENNYNQI